jgi:hypothetical protein
LARRIRPGKGRRGSTLKYCPDHPMIGLYAAPPRHYAAKMLFAGAQDKLVPGKLGILTRGY